MAEQQRIVKLGLGKRFKDMIAAVIGQMSDGYWENTPKMRGYWAFADADTQGDECVLKISPRTQSSTYNTRNLWAAMDDAHVKRFLADKIKFLIKEEGFKWDRAGTEETDYLSYSDPYKVKDCYYAYEVLKGRNVGKHQEYTDIKEALEAEGATSEANDAIKALFRQMVDDQGCRLLDGSDRGVEYRDQYNTKAFYMAGKLRFTFSKDDVEEEEALLDLAEKITGYGPATITSGSDRIAFALVLPENKAIEAVKDFFEVD